MINEEAIAEVDVALHQPQTPQPEAMPRGTEQLVRQIKFAIRRDTGSRIHNLNVMVTGTHVVLHGFCSTFHTYQLAQHAAMQLVDDLAVDNRIEVL